MIIKFRSSSPLMNKYTQHNLNLVFIIKWYSRSHFREIKVISQAIYQFLISASNVKKIIVTLIVIFFFLVLLPWSVFPLSLSHICTYIKKKGLKLHCNCGAIGKFTSTNIMAYYTSMCVHTHTHTGTFAIVSYIVYTTSAASAAPRGAWSIIIIGGTFSDRSPLRAMHRQREAHACTQHIATYNARGQARILRSCGESINFQTHTDTR